MEQRYTLRYTGGLVPDVYQCFTKEMGVFANPTTAKAPAKLRLAFEVRTLTFLDSAARLLLNLSTCHQRAKNLDE